MSLESLRGRLPFLVFLLLALVVLALLGFACACLTDQPIKAFERALSALQALPAIAQVWSFAAAALVAPAAAACARRPRPAALSPPELQRFLF